MRKIMAICVLLALVLACQANAASVVFDSFDGAYSGGPIGDQPTGWHFNGYGPPAYSQKETGEVISGSAYRITLPGSIVGVNGGAIYPDRSFDLNGLANNDIDWTKDVTVKVDVYGADYGMSRFDAEMLVMGFDKAAGAPAALFSFAGGQANGWKTLSMSLLKDPGQMTNDSMHIYLATWFNSGDVARTSNNTVIWDNLRVDYTSASAVPEPSSMIALLSGVLGLGGLIRRKK